MYLYHLTIIQNYRDITILTYVFIDYTPTIYSMMESSTSPNDVKMGDAPPQPAANEPTYGGYSRFEVELEVMPTIMPTFTLTPASGLFLQATCLPACRIC